MTGKENAPEIRFEGFTDPWEQRKLGDIAVEVTRVAPESSAPVMMISTPANGFIYQSEHYAFDNTGESLKKYIQLSKGEMAYNHGASKLRPYGSCFVMKEDQARVPFVYHCFRVPNSDPDFASLQLNLDSMQLQLRKLISSGARMDGLLNISYNEYMSLGLTMPSLSEQRQIGRYFGQLDSLITLHQRKYDKLCTVKKSMLDKMFPKPGETEPEIRFEGFTDPWEQRKFADEVYFFTGLTYTPSDVVDSPGTLVLRSSNVSGGGIVLDDNVYVNSSTPLSENVKPGDIIVVVRNGSRALIGKHAQVRHEMPNTVIGAFMTGIRSRVPQFINALLSTPAFENEVAMNMGATINQITLGMFGAMSFSFPSVSEQKAIGGLFYQLDSLITLHQRKLELLRNIKKSLLDRMFV